MTACPPPSATSDPRAAPSAGRGAAIRPLGGAFFGGQVIAPLGLRAGGAQLPGRGCGGAGVGCGPHHRRAAVRRSARWVARLMVARSLLRACWALVGPNRRAVGVGALGWRASRAVVGPRCGDPTVGWRALSWPGHCSARAARWWSPIAGPWGRPDDGAAAQHHYSGSEHTRIKNASEIGSGAPVIDTATTSSGRPKSRRTSPSEIEFGGRRKLLRSKCQW